MTRKELGITHQEPILSCNIKNESEEKTEVLALLQQFLARLQTENKRLALEELMK